MEQTTQGKVIKNVGVLDLRSATEETIAEIRYIGNVGVLLHSPENAALTVRLNMGNVGATLEVPQDARMVNGREVLGPDAFQHSEKPMRLLVNGQLIIKPDVSLEDVERGLGDLWINGQVLCPETLAGAIQARTRHCNGQFKIFKAYPKLIMGGLTLDESYLQSLEDGATLVVMGKLNAQSILPNDLIGQKLGQLQVMGRIVCREENKAALLARLDDSGTAKITTIPADHTPIEQRIVLDVDALETLPDRKLYCMQSVQIEPDVTADMLTQALDNLVVRGMLLCPASLKKPLSTICKLMETRAVFYEGELWLISDEDTLRASRFEYLDGNATLVVTGELTIDADIAPSVLADRLNKVHNFGEIICTPDQMGAIQARLGSKGGELIDSSQLEKEEEEEKEDENRIGNAGYLKL